LIKSHIVSGYLKKKKYGQNALPGTFLVCWCLEPALPMRPRTASVPIIYLVKTTHPHCVISYMLIYIQYTVIHHFTTEVNYTACSGLFSKPSLGLNLRTSVNIYYCKWESDLTHYKTVIHSKISWNNTRSLGRFYKNV